MLRSKTLTGIALAVAAGCFWGTMAVSGQYMITACGFNAEELTTVRIAGAGILMLVLGMLTEKNFFGSLRYLAVCRDVCFYGLCLFVIQYTFFLAIHACNAGTAAIMVGFGPIFIILWNILVKRQKIVPKEILAVIFAFVGVTLLITKGNFTSLSFSAMGIFWGLVSAGVGAFATIQPRRAIQKIGVTKVVSFGMFVGGILTCFMTPPWAISGHWTPMAIVAAVFVVVFGTVGAFWCYLRSTEFIPPALTSILASFEPLLWSYAFCFWELRLTMWSA